MSMTTSVPRRRAALAALHSDAACATTGESPEINSTAADHSSGTVTGCSSRRKGTS
jgi:hypothetical protein